MDKYLYLFVLFLGGVLCLKLDDVQDLKDKLIQKELASMIGSDIVLSEKEEVANEIIMEMKLKEIDYGFVNPQFCNFSKHFFTYKDTVRQSPLFQIIKDMPKGALLHAHDTAILSADYVLSLTYMDNLYVCITDDDLKFYFSRNNDIEDACASEWKLISELRSLKGDDVVDEKLKRKFSLVTEKPAEIYTDINAVWYNFFRYFIRTSNFFSYKPVWEQYYYDTLKALREDNVMYAEIRSVLPTLYDLDGKKYGSVETAGIYYNVLLQFLKDYPDFYGAKLIYAPLRLASQETVKKYIIIAKEIKEKYPSYLAGFDLVGQEDLGFPTKEFLPILTEAAEDLDFIFHAGETNWYGTSSDENLFDVIALGTKRIGHGYAIAKHPVLIEEIKKKDIALEVNVISNAVLKLVDDIRNHPLATFIAQGLPVVISSDDPGVWGADPLSHDFYATFVGVSSRRADIKLLKKLAMNSLSYSTYPDKDEILEEFKRRWDDFIDHLVDKYKRKVVSAEL